MFSRTEITAKARQIVERDIHANVNNMVEWIIQQEDYQAPFSWEDVTVETPAEDLLEAVIDQGLTEEVCDLVNQYIIATDQLPTDEELTDEYEDELRELYESYVDKPEIFTWYLVDGYLCSQLADMGEPVIADENLWGRTTFGQLIENDSVIEQIAKMRLERMAEYTTPEPEPEPEQAPNVWERFVTWIQPALAWNI